MKPKRFVSSLSAAATLVVAVSVTPSVKASTLSWDGSDSTAWTTGTNWTGDVAPANNLVTDTALFNLASYTNQPDAGTTAIKGITIGDGVTSTGALTISGTSLSIGSSGITMNANAGAATISAPITLGAAQTWTNNSSNTLSVGSIAPTAGSGTSVKFAGTGTINTTTTNTNGILGAWAVTGMAGTGGAAGNWATADGTGNIVTYTGYTDITGATNGAGASTQNWRATNAAASLTASATVNSLVMTTDFNIQSGATMTVGSGGMILSGVSRWLKNNGAGSTAGTGQITSGLASGELFIYSSGNSASDADWRIWTKIVNNGGTAVKVVKDGPGYLKLESSNTYTGGTIVNGGTLIGANAGSFGTGAVQVNSGVVSVNLNAGTMANNFAIATGASVTIDNATNNGTLNGNFSGAGTVTIQNTSGANLSENVGGDWSGFTGTLNYNTSNRVVNIFAPASMDLSHAAVNFANSGNLTNSSFRTSATGTTKFGSLSGFGYLEVNGATEIGNLGTNTTFSGVIRNAGSITKVGTGTLTLSGANTYTGATLINAGTLALASTGSLASTQITNASGATFDVSAVSGYTLGSGKTLTNNGTVNGSFTVASGATLNGSGTFNHAVTVNGALNPGNSPGSQTFASGLTLGAASVTTMEIAGLGGVAGTDFDFINVTGGTMTNDGSLAIVDFGGFDISAQTGTYNLFDFVAGAGDFDAVTVDGTSLAFNGGTDTWNSTVGDVTYNFAEGTGVLSVTVVPEPTAALLGGLGLLGLLRRRRVA
jgi:fibronectin-binding autotransporter adhesin